jgi:beta-fructofuranosidase
VALRLADDWVWDSWQADDGREFHLFYLHAPRSLGDQILRHVNATIGHAISPDLRHWQVLSNALEPGPEGAWDDVATWTGSVLRHGDTWFMCYTGVSSIEKGLIQRLGIATSPDLVTWTKHPSNPVSEADPRWYEQLNLEAWHDQAWRDPWVLPDPGGNGFHALICARLPEGAPDDARGVIGHAWSPDLVTWEARPPLSQPGEFGHMEVPQVEIVDGTPVLLFSSARRHTAAQRRARLPDGQCGSFLAIGESLLGPWDIENARPIPVPDLYSARIVRDRAGEWQVLGFIDGSEHGAFVGELSDPVPLRSLGLI